MIQGICPPRFEELKNILQIYLDNKEEIGANFSVVKNNQILVNIYGGQKNQTNLWDENTIVNTFSVSKGLYACCIAKLVQEKEIDIEKKVRFYWPEFRNNKESILVKDILSHQSGLYRFKEQITNNDLLDHDKIINILEKQIPDHLPGERTYYHAKTHGYLVENLIRKITQKNLKEFFDENFSKKYELNFNFGFKKNDFDNAGDLVEDILDSKKVKKKDFDAFNNPEHDINFYNSREWRLAGVSSMGGHGSALAIAKIYDLLANDLKSDNKNIISKNNFKKMLQQPTMRLDESLNLPIKWTYSGFILRGGSMFGKNKEAFGHNGWGGSVGFGDPIEGIGIAYVTRKINSSMKADIRAIRLIKKFYEILNYNV
jgi:CubicO group peptidase (beta-lactamase class C family)